MTERQKKLFLDNFKQFDDDYIEIDCKAIYNIDKLKELIDSHLYDNFIIRRKRQEIMLRKPKIMEIKKELRLVFTKYFL